MRFPMYSDHEQVICFHCNTDLGNEEKAISGNYSGKYYKNCPECGYNTYYDVPKGYVKNYSRIIKKAISNNSGKKSEIKA